MAVTTFREYSEEVENRLPKDEHNNSENSVIPIDSVLRLYEAAASIVSPIRKTEKGNFHEGDIDKEKLKQDMGRCLLYIATIAAQLGDFDLQEIAFSNLEKTYCNYQKKDKDYSDNIAIGDYSSGISEFKISRRKSFFSHRWSWFHRV